jgi:hypothetical protein
MGHLSEAPIRPELLDGPTPIVFDHEVGRNGTIFEGVGAFISQ